MRELKPNPCHKCTDKRFIGCHGKHSDGTWRCKEYGEAYEKADADYNAYQESAQAIVDRYEKDNRNRVYERMLKAGGKKNFHTPVNRRRHR